MSNRRRPARTATAGPRPPVRPPAARRVAHRPGATPPAAALRSTQAAPGRTTAWLLALLAVAAEAGHLVAALVEWPQAPWRGAYHVLVGGLLGVVAALATDRGGRVRTVVAATVGLLGPTAWLTSALAGVAVWHASPLPLPVAVTGAELVLVVVLSGLWSTPRVPGADARPPT